MEEMDFVDFWARKCKADLAKCVKEVLAFNDAQLEIANDFYKRLARTKGGRKKILKLKRITVQDV